MSYIKKTWKKTKALVISMADRMSEDAMSAYAGQATLYIVLSFFPFLMFLLALISFLPLSQQQLIDFLGLLIPESVMMNVLPFINEVYESSTGAVLSVTIIFALWAGSKGIMTIFYGLNSVCMTQKKSNYLVVRLRSILYTIIFGIMLVAMLVVNVWGDAIIRWLVAHVPFEFLRTAQVIKNLSLISSIAVLFVFFLLMYKFLPDRKTKVVWEIPGALIASVGWMGFSFLYSIYINNLSNMSSTYGSLTTIVLCITWLYACVCILLFGEEINCMLINHRNMKLAAATLQEDDKVVPGRGSGI